MGHDPAVTAPSRPQAPNAPRTVQQAIAHASQRTSIDFDYLIAKAEIESAMNPEAKAKTSSASGLFQFIESTWLQTMKRHGARFGLGEIADRISMSASGQAWVSDPGQRQAILSMRFDPQVASLMAAGLAEDNRDHLMPILGREPNDSEMYLAHFLGAGGAGRFLAAMASNPQQSAPSLFPKAASANRAVFYERSGEARSLSGVMQFLSDKMERALERAPDAGVLPAYSTAPYISVEQSIFYRSAPSAQRSGTPAIPAFSNAPMSRVLQSTFGADGSMAGPAYERVQRAYSQLKAFGL